MSDAKWKDMQAGKELDRYIAERKGWKDIHEVSDYHGEHGEMPFTLWYGYAPGDQEPHAVAPYSTDANYALGLISDLHLQVDYWPNTSRPFGVSCFNETALIKGHGKEETLALAICYAWLDWKDKTQ